MVGVVWNQQVLETAFKNETIGLVTREEFIQKRTTLEERWVDVDFKGVWVWELEVCSGFGMCRHGECVGL